MNKNDFHLVVRFSDKLFDVGNVVSRHNNVVSNHGYVWFGKMGGTISAQRIELLNRQIEDGTPTFLYLAQGNWRKPKFYRAKLVTIVKALPPKQKKHIPAYYSSKGLTEFIGVWMKIGKITLVESSSLREFRTVNSALPLHETFALSSSGYFLVHKVD